MTMLAGNKLIDLLELLDAFCQEAEERDLHDEYSPWVASRLTAVYNAVSAAREQYRDAMAYDVAVNTKG